MSAEMIQAVSKGAQFLNRIKSIATAHPAITAVCGTVVAGAVLVGGYKVCKKAFSEKEEKPVEVHATVDINDKKS